MHESNSLHKWNTWSYISSDVLKMSIWGHVWHVFHFYPTKKGMKYADCRMTKIYTISKCMKASVHNLSCTSDRLIHNMNGAHDCLFHQMSSIRVWGHVCRFLRCSVYKHARELLSTTLVSDHIYWLIATKSAIQPNYYLIFVVRHENNWVY